MFLKSDGILVKFPFSQGNVGKFFVSVHFRGISQDLFLEMICEREVI